MYLVIFEDLSLVAVKGLTEDEFKACESGLVVLVDVRNPHRPLDYRDGAWKPVRDSWPAN